MTPTESHDIAQRLVALATQRTKRAEAAAEFVVALVLGIIGALLLVHWATPCEAGHLCALAAITRTRTPLHLRAYRALRGWYLRVLIRSATADLAAIEEAQIRIQGELESLPYAASLTRQHIAALQVRLITHQG